MKKRLREERDPWMSASDLANMLPVAAGTILKFMKNGELESIHIGKRWFTRRSTVERWIAANTRKRDDRERFKGQVEEEEERQAQGYGL